MKMRGARSPEGQKIVDAYARAKMADPRMTQAKFYARARAEAGMKPIGDPGAEFRRIARGERSGVVTYRKAIGLGKGQKAPKSRGLFQMAFQDDHGNVIASENLTVFGGAESAFDIPAIEAEMKRKHATHLTQLAASYARRYNAPNVNPLNIRVRLVNEQHRRAFHLAFGK